MNFQKLNLEITYRYVTQAMDLLSGMPITTVLQETLTPTLFNASSNTPRLQVRSFAPACGPWSAEQEGNWTGASLRCVCDIMAYAASAEAKARGTSADGSLPR